MNVLILGDHMNESGKYMGQPYQSGQWQRRRRQRYFLTYLIWTLLTLTSTNQLWCMTVSGSSSSIREGKEPIEHSSSTITDSIPNTNGIRTYQPLVINSMTPITVHLVPHSHLDAGWKETFDNCYVTRGASIIESVVYELVRDESRRFTWSDLAFLFRWLEERSQKPVQVESIGSACQQVHPRLRSCVCGEHVHEQSPPPPVVFLHLIACLIFAPPFQLALVGGSYTAMDSAVTSPLERIEGFELGQYEWKKWDKRMQEFVASRFTPTASTPTIPVPPRPFSLGYDIDQFGHSGSDPVLSAGIGHVGILMGRVPFSRHQQIRRSGLCEFWWSAQNSPYQREDEAGTIQIFTTSTSPVLTSLLYDHYSSPPCLAELQYRRLVRGGQSPWNSYGRIIDETMTYLIDRTQVPLQTRDLIILVGDDFRYRSRQEVDRLYTNLNLIIVGINHLATGIDSTTTSTTWRDLLTSNELDDLKSKYGHHRFRLRISTAQDYFTRIRSQDPMIRSSEEAATIEHATKRANLINDHEPNQPSKDIMTQSTIFPLAPPSSFPWTLSSIFYDLTSSLSIDFFPYSDKWFDNVWSGYWSNIPFLKYYTRSLIARRRSLSTAIGILHASITHQAWIESTALNLNQTSLQLLSTDLDRWSSIASRLRSTVGRNLFLNLHHDALTGTHRDVVRADYFEHAWKAEQELAQIQTEIGRARLAQIAINHTDSPSPTPPFQFTTSAVKDHEVMVKGVGKIVDIDEPQYIVDITSLLLESPTGATPPPVLLISLFNPLNMIRTEVFPLTIHINCTDGLKRPQYLFGQFPALQLFDSFGDELRIQYQRLESEATNMNTSESPSWICDRSSDNAVGSPSTQFILYAEVTMKSLQFETLQLLLSTKDSHAPPSLVRWSTNGITLLGAQHDAHISFNTVDGQFSYTLTKSSGDIVPPPIAPTVSSGLNFRHTHHLYLSSTRQECNSGAYIFRALFPSAYGAMVGYGLVGWFAAGLGVIILAKLASLCKISVFYNNQAKVAAPSPSYHVQLILVVVLTVTLICLVFEDSLIISHSTVKYLLSPKSNSPIFRFGIGIGVIHSSLIIMSSGNRSIVSHLRQIVLSGLIFIFTSVSVFLLFPSYQSRLLRVDDTARPSPRVLSASSTSSSFQSHFSLLADGPLFSEVSYTTSPSIWQSIRVYHLSTSTGSLHRIRDSLAQAAFNTTDPRQPDTTIPDSEEVTKIRVAPFISTYQNDIVQYRWSVKPCKDCQLATRIAHEPASIVTPPSTTRPTDPTTIPAEIASLPEQLFHQTVQAVINLCRYFLQSSNTHFLTNDGMTVLSHPQPRLTAYLATRYSPFQSATILDRDTDINVSDESTGYSIFFPHTSIGGTRWFNSFEWMYQRWLTRDDEKGLESGVKDSHRSRLTAFIRPKWSTVQTDVDMQPPTDWTRKMSYLSRTNQYQSCAQQPLLPLSVEAKLPHVALASPFKPTLPRVGGHQPATPEQIASSSTTASSSSSPPATHSTTDRDGHVLESMDDPILPIPMTLISFSLSHSSTATSDSQPDHLLPPPTLTDDPASLHPPHTHTSSTRPSRHLSLYQVRLRHDGGRVVHWSLGQLSNWLRTQFDGVDFMEPECLHRTNLAFDHLLPMHRLTNHPRGHTTSSTVPPTESIEWNFTQTNCQSQQALKHMERQQPPAPTDQHSTFNQIEIEFVPNEMIAFVLWM